MPWQAKSSRRAPLPPNWAAIRRQVFARDNHWCRIPDQHHCTGEATEVDHTGNPDDHRLEMLRSACHNGHAARTTKQSHASRPRRHRPTSQHPGLI